MNVKERLHNLVHGSNWMNMVRKGNCDPSFKGRLSTAGSDTVGCFGLY